jgi:diacylglycerol kinase (ATP)
MAPRALLIVNPVARGLPPMTRLEEAAARMRGAGWETSLEVTQASGHATELARRAALAGCDAVIACGGDGTVNEVVNGIAGSETALAVIPGGTANVWAKEVRLPRDAVGAAEAVVSAETRRVDLGLALRPSQGGAEPERRYFLLMAGIGIDAHVLSVTPGEVKRRLGAASYVVRGVGEVIRYRSRPVSVRLDDEETFLDLSWMLVGNTRSYGGVVNVARDALADDGLLDVYAVEGHGWRRAAAILLRVLTGRLAGARGVVSRRVRSLELPPSPTLPMQVDGDYLGPTPVRIVVEPRALSVMVPRGLRSPLFSETEAAPPLEG